MPDTRLYDQLGVIPSASDSEIKKAYKKAALLYHPDKNPDCEDLYREVLSAYEILSDPKKRKIYNQYGELGLQIYQSYGANAIGDIFIDSFKLGLVFGLSSFIILLLAAQLVLLGVKVTGTIDWNWVIVFTPLWVLDLTLAYVYYLYYSISYQLQEDSFDQDEMSQQTSGTSDESDVDGQTRQKAVESRKIIFMNFLKSIFKLFLIITFQGLLALRLDRLEIARWMFVWGALLLHELVCSIEAMVELHRIMNSYDEMLKEAEEDQSFGTRLYTYFELFKYLLFRDLFLVLVNVRYLLDYSEIHVAWTIVFIPLLAGTFVIPLVDLLWDHYQSRYCESEEDKKNMANVFKMKLVLYIIAMVFVYCFIIMLCTYLDLQAPSVMYAFIPIFVFLSICLCCCGFILPGTFLFVRVKGNLDDYSIVKKMQDYRPKKSIEWKNNKAHPTDLIRRTAHVSSSLSVLQSASTSTSSNRPLLSRRPAPPPPIEKFDRNHV